MENVIHYIRVSTDEQADRGYSLRDQAEKLAKHSADRNCTVVASFSEDYSAKTFERPEFKKLLAFIRKNKGLVTKLKFIRWDRFSRNATDALVMIRDLTSLGVECEAIDQPLDMRIPENKLLLVIYLSAPEIENDRRSINTSMGMRRAMKEGRYCSIAPFGYKYTRDERNKPILIPNDAKADLIKEAFQLYATGRYDKTEVQRILRKKGMTLARNRFSLMFHNVVYCGKIHIKAQGNEPEQIVQGIHEPLVDEVLFEQVQLVAGRKKTILSKPTTVKDELPLRGFLICPACAGNLTGSASRGRWGNRHFYYHCQKGCKTRFRADEANTTFADWLENISLKPEHVQSYLQIIGTLHKKEAGDRKSLEKANDTEIKKVEDCLLKADRMYLNDDLDSESYNRLKESYKQDLTSLKVRKAQINELNDDLVGQMEFAFQVMSNLGKLWKELDLHGKRVLVGSIFSEKLIFENGKYRTPNAEGTLAEFFNIDEGSGGRKTKKAFKIEDLSFMVARRGIEPLLPG